MNIEKKGILNKREYLGTIWLVDVWPANEITFCSIFTYFQYSLIHDLTLTELDSKYIIVYQPQPNSPTSKAPSCVADFL